MKTTFYNLILIMLLPAAIHGQEGIIEGVPPDLDVEKLILLKHEPIQVGAEEPTEASREYVIRRQKNHNRVLEEFNRELEMAAVKYYPFEYAIATPSSFESLWDAGYKYVLDSGVYDYVHYEEQPEEDELIVFGYFIRDRKAGVIYKPFELDEMKVYDAKMIMRKLKRAIKKEFPGAYN